MKSFPELAAAIRRGAALRPQTTEGGYYEQTSRFTPFASCALGAAFEAAQGPWEPDILPPRWVALEDLYQAFPCLGVQAPRCPERDCSVDDASHYLFFDGRDTLSDLINHLNDEHEWTREAIADFVDTLAVGVEEVVA